MKQTDWNTYYKKPYKISGFTKGIITRELLTYLKKHIPAGTHPTMLEFGGGNSCFYELFNETFKPETYYIVDNNRVGLDAFSRRIGNRENTRLICEDILDMKSEYQCDVVFSVGLIEHFSEADTRRAIQSHFDVLRSGGLLVLGFPTPTILYRMTRKLSELLGLWIFHDERPLTVEEVNRTVTENGQLLEQKIIWPIFLTQAMLTIKKNK
jgi:SAM-dependent methyltransferase